MTWKCWLAIGLIVFALGVAIGALVRQTLKDRALLGILYDQIAELRAEADESGKAADKHKATADRLAKQAGELAAALAESRKKAAAVNRTPKTLAECMEGLQVLTDHISLLEHDLALSRAEAIELREAHRLKSLEVVKLNEALDLSKQAVDMTLKDAKKQKRNSIIGTTLACSAAAVGMYGLGTLR